MLVNGVLSDSIHAADRGLQYGDGVFRTLRIIRGQPQQWQRHYRKLQHDCGALDLACPAADLLLEELQRLAGLHAAGIARITITRGHGARGYAPPVGAVASRILSLSPLPDHPERFGTHGIRLHLCDLRLAHQPRLAGIKHLNRLENVLAAAEWNDAEFAEGLLLDVADNVVSGTRSNLFLVRDGALHTPALSRCGVAGVQRERVLEWAAANRMACMVRDVSLTELLEGDEVFLVNSVIGLWPVRELQGRSWERHPLSQQIRVGLLDAHD